MRVALVTGAARGIGRAIAADLGRDHHLAFTYLTTDPGPLLKERPDALAIRADLRDPAASADIVAQIIARFGALDTLVMNAGVVAMDADDASADIFNVNVLGPKRLLDAALPHLQSGAAIVNISSVNATLPARGAALYSASKAALNTWTRAMAKELGPDGIRVNALAPGATEIPEAPRDPDLVKLFVEMTALDRVGPLTTSPPPSASSPQTPPASSPERSSPSPAATASKPFAQAAASEPALLTQSGQGPAPDAREIAEGPRPTGRRLFPLRRGMGSVSQGSARPALMLLLWWDRSAK